MDIKKTFLLLFSWRIVLFYITYLSALVLPTFGYRFPYAVDYLTPTGLPYWIWSWGNFDGVHYLTIAERGYVADFIQAFFPFYPILTSAIGSFFFGQYLLVGIILSTTAFFLGFYFLMKLLQLDYSKQQIWWVCLFLLLFPTSFYFGAIYTEGIFFFLVISSFYFARKQKWWLAAMLGIFASATRFAGIFLLPALLLEYYLQQRKKNEKIIPEKKVLFLLLIPLGLIGYMFFLWHQYKDPFLFFHALPDFNTGRSNTIVLLPQVFWRYIKIFATVNPSSLAFFNALYEFLTTILFGILLVVSVFKTRLSYVLFSFLVFISPTLTGTLTSMPRYVLLCFSCFIVLGLMRSTILKVILLTFFSLLLVISLLLFARGYWIA